MSLFHFNKEFIYSCHFDIIIKQHIKYDLKLISDISGWPIYLFKDYSKNPKINIRFKQ